jgi:hypothetical protein
LTTTRWYVIKFPVWSWLFTIIQLFKKATIWAVIESFTNIKFAELSGDNINSLTNVITLDGGVHHFFGQLKVWFEAVPVRCAFLCDVDRNRLFAILLFQDKPTTYIFRKFKEYLLGGT